MERPDECITEVNDDSLVSESLEFIAHDTCILDQEFFLGEIYGREERYLLEMNLQAVVLPGCGRQSTIAISEATWCKKGCDRSDGN
ncbi:hypothetical protein PAXRUDRAFT_827052 [Paxillus rubicundulus Ve08.2h10]|uniref:Uncharacterized protein n=1 Tax=Paxillus rubicundulus Ve08.2h10 TaxID=930991 RepID=A0A0D0DR94_9AGAM|nr:hypothetical protein PAXRUDRAFT_827052 [Paxillus rubicundulus Ve08.2h10]